MPSAEVLSDQITRNGSPGPFFEEEAAGIAIPKSLPVQLIAFHLPQFHPIPENDRWWSRGFTEWTNVTRALPRFAGHYQPRLPRDLGFYDLRDADVLRRQAALARSFGIAGFCFHHYWFAGKRLLETPLNNLLASPDIDLPFCVNWANENWTRTWDGKDREVLMAQAHSPEDDIAFARSLLPLFRDRRYIRIRDRPLLMLYRPGLLPDAAGTVLRWREFFSRNGVADPFIVMPQAFGDEDPRRYGMDAAVGFPPHKAGDTTPLVTPSALFDHGYRGVVKPYIDLMQQALQNRPTDFRLFPGVCPQWDNEARRPSRGVSYVGSTPVLYGRWLEEACRWVIQVADADERVVFINAWNEWAEGAYLEPDRHFGHAYLAETARALSRLDAEPSTTQLPEEHPDTAYIRQEETRRRRIIRRGLDLAASAAERMAGVLRAS
jgi:lipopolysaccharide biosynthesis protein